jgi:hypothetical protein
MEEMGLLGLSELLFYNLKTRKQKKTVCFSVFFHLFLPHGIVRMKFICTLATLLACVTIARGEISFNVDYSDCYGDDIGETPHDSFAVDALENLFFPISQVIWRSSPDYVRSDDALPTKIYCREIHIQGTGTSGSNTVTCDGTVYYPEGEDSGKADLFTKYMVIRDSCVIS